MKNIPNRKLSQEELNKLLTRYKIITGGEATICESDKSYSLFKIFTKHGKVMPMCDNKQKKIDLLYQRQIDYCTKPISTISVDGTIVGYEVFTDCYFDTYKVYQLTKEELLQFLKESRKILEYFKKINIAYGDVDFRNILFNKDTGEVMFCDMDNIQIDGFKMDKLPLSLTEYDSVRGIDEEVNSFMHNNMTLRSFDEDVHCITNYGIRQLFKRPAKKIILSMRNPLEYKDDYIIDYIKKE